MRLIDADAIIKELEEMANNEWNISVGSSKGLTDAIDVIDNALTVEYPFYQEAYQTGYEEGKNERPQGEWIDNEYSDGYDYRICSICKFKTVAIVYKFCPNCGAKMGNTK